MLAGAGLLLDWAEVLLLVGTELLLKKIEVLLLVETAAAGLGKGLGACGNRAAVELG